LRKSSLPKALAALSRPGFRWLLLAQALALQGSWIQSTAQRWLVLELSNSPFFVGLFGAVAALPILLFSFMGGYLSDRLGRFSVLFFAHFLIFCQGMFLGVMVQTSRINVPILLITAFFLGTGMAFEVPTRQSLIFDLVGREYITNALALHSTAFNLARFIGPAIAGILMSAGLLCLCFYSKGLSSLVAIIILSIISRQGHSRKRGTPAERGRLKDGVQFAFQNRVIRHVLFLILIFGVTLLPYSILMPSIGRDLLGLGAREYGLLCAANGLGALIGAIFVAMFGHRGKRDTWWWTGAVLFPVTLIFVGLTRGFCQASAALFFSGFSMVICATSAISLLQIHSKDHLRGQMMGLFTTSFMGLFPLGSLLVGAMAAKFGVRDTLFAQGGTALTAVLITLFLVFRPLQKGPS